MAEDEHLVDEELMTDEDFVKAIEAMNGEEDGDIGELLKAMNENRIISWEEAERILQDTDNQPVKSSLPEQTRPSEPDNDTDVEKCIQKLLDNDPTLKEINLNNMKRTPIPQIRRLVEALAYNEYCERLSLANMGLYDNDMLMLITVVEMNSALKKINLETNYLSGDFFSKLFKAALNTMSIEEVKAVNQGVSFATTAEKEIIESIVANKGLIKVSVNLRLPEGRHKIENATLRNGEYKRIIRREAAAKAKWEAEELAKNPVPHLPKDAAKPAAAKVPRPLPSCLTNPTLASAAKEKPKVESPITKKPPAILDDKQPLRKTGSKPLEDLSKVTPLKKPLKKTETAVEDVSKTTPLKKPLKKTDEVETPEKRKPVPKKTPALARRQSNADPSATPVINIAPEPEKKPVLTTHKSPEAVSGTTPKTPAKAATTPEAAKKTDTLSSTIPKTTTKTATTPEAKKKDELLSATTPKASTLKKTDVLSGTIPKAKEPVPAVVEPKKKAPLKSESGAIETEEKPKLKKKVVKPKEDVKPEVAKENEVTTVDAKPKKVVKKAEPTGIAEMSAEVKPKTAIAKAETTKPADTPVDGAPKPKKKIIKPKEEVKPGDAKESTVVAEPKKLLKSSETPVPSKTSAEVKPKLDSTTKTDTPKKDETITSADTPVDGTPKPKKKIVKKKVVAKKVDTPAADV